MAKIYAIKGLLLEEVLLRLLKASGYFPVEYSEKDSTLVDGGGSGIKVRGRGSNHQIDAIADFSISPPFSSPIRLLLEAKFYHKTVGIPIVRNAVGVLTDVSEFWVTSRAKSKPECYKPRYHYQYAIFTSSSFSKEAQEYAFAHNIYLIKLENNRYFSPVVGAIDALSYEDFGGASNDEIKINMIGLRKAIRRDLKHNLEHSSFMKVKDYCREDEIGEEGEKKLLKILETVYEVSSSYLGVLGNGFPIFLTPSKSFKIDDLINDPKIQIWWDDEKWYIVKKSNIHEQPSKEKKIFSFDLPQDLFKLYSKNGILSEKRALNLKGNLMSSIQIVFRNPDTTKRIISCLELELDSDWLRRMEERY